MSTLTDRMNECVEFLSTIWGEEDLGFYALVVAQENPDGAADNEDTWHTFSFRWPKGKLAAIKRIAAAEQAGANVFICPALYNAPNRLREHVAGSWVLWMDSDGNAPKTFDGPVPDPSIRVRSSGPRNIHHYWLLDEFCTDIATIETGNRSITSYYDGDQGCWDASRLLRPPGTTNRKNGLPVRVLS